MSLSNQEYLLKKYLSGSKNEQTANKKSKKKREAASEQPVIKKRKRKALLIDEDNDAIWQNEFDEDEAPILVTEKVVQAHFLSRKKSGWTIIRGGESDDLKDEAEEEAEEVKEEIDDEEIKMSSGARAGLQTGEQVAADIKRQELLIRKKLKAMKAEETGKDAETVYRDLKGRRLDVKEELAKVEAQELEKKELERAIQERNKGFVQKEQAQLRREALAKASSQTLARYADDPELNSELKEKPRWEDPAAGFLSTTTKKKSRYPKYQGPAPPPNRYNIQPGYRWDGVDRSNGYEKQLFLRLNSRKAQAAEIHAWATEDM